MRRAAPFRPWDDIRFLDSLRRAENKPQRKLKPDGNRAVILCSTTDPYQVFKASTPEKTKLHNDSAFALVGKLSAGWSRRALEKLTRRVCSA